MSAPRITKDQIGALMCAFGAAAGEAQKWGGWTEEKFVKLARFAWRHERDGFDEAFASMQEAAGAPERP